VLGERFFWKKKKDRKKRTKKEGDLSETQQKAPNEFLL